MNSSPNRAARLTSRLNLRTALINLSVALVSATVVAVPALIQLADRDGTIADRDATIDAVSQELDTATARLESRQETIESLRAENIELRAALPYTVAAEDVPAIRMSTTVTLAKDGDVIDLNSTEPNFGAARHTSSMDTLSYNGTAVRLGYGISTLTLMEQVAQYESCAAASGYAQVGTIEPHLLSAPATCLRLSTDRFATIQASRSDNDSADIVITVWE
ncbi:hypothetical protein [Microbacterium resistens]|uniref:hypothetical protein n=1 Tax=Microbacterium resistens TaxID=156977 RepID=UPI00366D3D49